MSAGVILEVFEADDGWYVRLARNHGFSAFGDTIPDAIREFSVAFSLLEHDEIPWQEVLE